MKTSKTVVLSTDYRTWNTSGSHYSVVTTFLVRLNGVWSYQVKSHEVDQNLGWCGNHQVHTNEVALDGLQRAVAHRKRERQTRRENRAFTRAEAEKWASFEQTMLQIGFQKQTPKKATTKHAWKRGGLCVRQMWHGGWRIDGINPSETAHSMDALMMKLVSKL